MAKNKDLSSEGYNISEWGNNNPQVKLNEIKNYVVKIAEDASNWYMTKKTPKRIIGRILRYCTLILFPAAGLVPLFLPDETYLPTILVGIGGILLSIDKFGGFTSSWIRFIQAGQSINQKIQAFHLEWEIKTIVPAYVGSPNTITDKIKLCQKFVTEIQTIVKDETDKWIADFESALKDMDTAAKAAQDKYDLDEQKRKLCGLNITVSNSAVFNLGWSAELDGKTEMQVKGSKAAFSEIEPGIYKLHVWDKLNNTNAELWETIKFTDGQIVEKTFSLPIKTKTS